jgi:hypothetical protein
MAIRVDDTEVEAIIDTESHIDTDAFITTANAMVDEYLADSDLSAAILTEIEKYLAAHFIAIKQRVLKSEKYGDAKDDYAVKVGMGLDATPYGQQVKILDSSGLLANVGAKRRAVFETVAIDLGVD